MIVLKFISFIVRLLPLGVALKVGEWLGMLVWWLFPSRRKITADNLKKAFARPVRKNVNGDKDISCSLKHNEGLSNGVKMHQCPATAAIKTNRQLHKIAQGMAKNMGKNLMEFFRLPALSKDNIENYIEFNGLEHLENALRLKRGVFILTAHLGNWDLVAAACVLKGYRVNVVTKHLKISLFNKFWLDYRARMNINQIYREGSLREIISALKRNELMGFILDQHAKSSDGILIDFFNRPAWTTPSLAVLAQRYNAPVVPCFIVRQNDGRHKIIFEPDIPFREMPTPEETIRYNTQIYTDVIERYIRAYPEQWIWMHRRWKTKGI